MVTEETNVKRVSTADGSGQAQRTVVERTTTPSPLAMVRNIVYVLFAALETLLFIRLILSLLGANRTNAFANFIYSLSAPFVSPFRGLFSVQSSIGLGTARFEYEVVVAMIVYGLLAMLILMLLRIPDHSDAGEL